MGSFRRGIRIFRSQDVKFESRQSFFKKSVPYKSYVFYLIYSCTPNTEYKNLISDPETYNAVVKNLSDVVVYDI